MPPEKLELPQGTLELLILQTIEFEPEHGWGISERINQRTGGALQVQQGSMYPALHRMERRGLISPDWRVSENGRKAKYYKLTDRGRKQLRQQSEAWLKLTQAVAMILTPEVR